MPKIFLIVFLLFNLILIRISIKIEATSRFERDSGILGPIISAQEQIGKDSQQYFLCGFAFRQMKFTKLLYNCNCGYRFEGLSVVYKCDWCSNSFWTMSNAFRATFCHYQNWSDQVVKIQETGNTQSQNWRQFWCPQGTYGRKAAVRLAKDQETDVGFVGMQLLCSARDLSSTYKVQDDNKYPLTRMTTNPDRTFISGLQIKYDPNGKLTGVNLMFQRMAIISAMSIKYISTGTPEPVKKIIESIYLGNAEKYTIEKILKPTKTYEYLSYWNNFLPHIAHYILKPNQGLKVPILASRYEGSNLSYKQDSPGFKFDTQITTKLFPSSNMLVSMQPRSVINATIFIQQIQISQAYEITVTFADIITGKIISEKVIKGIYTGVIISSIKVFFSTEQMSKIINPSLYYTYFPTGQIDANEYRWTLDFGGNKGSVNTDVEVPFGYWLVGMQIGCGHNLDAVVFEYTSNEKDLISRGWYGGSGGGSMAFRSNYLNSEWITIMNIWQDANILYGIEVITNKGNKSIFCGRALGSLSVFNAPWYKRFKINTTPFWYMIKGQFMPWSRS